MFGYITANDAALTDAQQRRYRGCYCGLASQKLPEKHYAGISEKYKHQCDSMEKNLLELS